MARGRAWFVAVAALAAVELVVPTGAEAAGGPVGAPCALAVVEDRNPEAPDDAVTGFLSGGPYDRSGTLVCSIQVGDPVHSGPDSVYAAGTGTNGVTVLAPTVVSYLAPPEAPVYVCTRWHDNETVLFWDAADRTWTTDPSSPCAGQDAAGTVTGGLPAGRGPDPWGGLCRMDALGSGTAETGVVSGGPLLVDDANGTTYAGTLTCSVQLAGGHAAPDVCTASGSGAPVVIITARTCSWAASAEDDVFVCSRIDVDGWPALYFDDAAGRWSTAPDVACQRAVTVTAGARVPDDVRAIVGVPAHASGGGPSTEEKRARKAERQKERRGPVPDDTTPYHPSGTIEITRSAAGIVNYYFTGFVPPVSDWTCPTAATSVTCTPPGPPEGTYLVCGSVTVEASATSTGSVNGTSRCDSGATASASSQGPATAPTPGAASPRTTFPWHCAATPQGAVVWTVRCTVGL
jgi:hypothetical protein